MSFSLFSAFLALPILTTKIQFDGLWGDWTQEWTAAPGYYLCGGQMRFHGVQGGYRDDTAANGIIYYFCRFGNWDQKVGYRFDGYYGDWYSIVMCPRNSFTSGFQPRFESNQGNGDDTALNGIKFICRDPMLGNQSWITIFQGVWGDWRDVVHLNDRNEFIIRYGFRYDWSRSGDPTTWNGIFFQSERYLPSQFQFQYQMTTIKSLRPQSINKKQVYNCLNVSVMKEVSFEKTIQTSTQYTNQNGYLVGVTMSAQFGFQTPVASVSGGVQVSFTTQESFTFGKEQRTASKFVDTSVLECPARNLCTINQMVKSGSQNIPYRMKLIFPRGENMWTNGVFKGVLASRTYEKIQTKEITNCPIMRP